MPVGNMKKFTYSCAITLLLLVSNSSPVLSESKPTCEGTNYLLTSDGRCINFSSSPSQTESGTASTRRRIPANQKFPPPVFGPIVEPDVTKICKSTLRQIYSSYSVCVSSEEKAKKFLEDNEDSFMKGDIQQCYSEGTNLSKPVISYVQKLNCIRYRMNRRNYLKN